ncbi:hypothetical protein EHQ81_00850 [Leptospira selangorensis]|uniref:Uncharacterized protein n=1 Tax=Leptospira selangorensis TaxID=2484982 RepID=A0A5F2C2Q1_9LEPT|nr:hypothetical protein [Leptospira selangorensis]TGM17091.1 hypothetical protein EHQ81_00850 [Leptospira selangorensis]TGM21429.1 hypothetical protein EHQ82_10595 [Leptospira selangorensis]
MNEIQRIRDNGFSLDENKKAENIYSNSDLKFIALGTALRAFFSLHKSIFSVYDVYDHEKKRLHDTHKITENYIDSYYRIIIHFQHYFELIIKEFLRKENELLTLSGIEDIALTYKILKKQQINSQILSKANTAEFSESLKRLKKLCNDGLIKDAGVQNFIKGSNQLDCLNYLRNRIWHRGTYFLYFPDILLLIGKYILPLVIDSLSILPKSFKKIMERKLNIDIDPISEIILEYKANRKINFGKLICLLELGRASFENPMPIKIKQTNSFYKHFAAKYERIAAKELDFDPTLEVKRCPVCGINALVISIDVNSVGAPEAFDAYCNCCNYKADSPIYDPNKYGFSYQLFDLPGA